MDPYISYRYIDGRHDRTIEAPCSSAHLRISAGVARPLPGESTEVYTAWCEEQDLTDGEQPDVDAWEDDGGPEGDEETVTADDDTTEPEAEAEPEEEAEDEDEPQAVTADDDESDGWPEGYTYTRRGSYYDVTTPDGDPLGTFRGETAGIEAAWRHRDG